MNLSWPSAGKLTLALATTALIASCSSNNPLYCDLRNTCEDGERNFCDIDQAYPGTTLTNECIARPSADACNRAQPCTEPLVCSGEAMGTCVECTKNIHCDNSLHCDPRNNQCTTDTIIACDPDAGGDAECAAAAEELPFCGVDEICVACRNNSDCEGNLAKAVCDEVDFSCRGCLENAECQSRLCGDGTCAASEDIVYVSGADGVDDMNCGSQTSPCHSIEKGIEQVAGTRTTVLIAEGTYPERISIVDTSLNLRGEGQVLVRASLGDSEQILSVSGTSQVVVRDIEFAMLSAPPSADMVSCVDATAHLVLQDVLIHGANDAGVVGENCSLEIRNSTVSASSGVGVATTNGTLSLQASEILDNGKGGIDIDGSNYSIVNSFICHNGGPASVTGGVRIEATSNRDEEFAYNTIAQNSRVNTAGIGSALRCEVTAVVASNNIFMLEDGSSADLVSGCDTQYSLFDTDSLMATGTGNISAEATFKEPATRNFHLLSGSAGIDEANMIPAIDVDYDGEARPQGAGPDMGADEAE